MRRRFDPDVTRRDDAAYWAAALVLALRADDEGRAQEARRELERLGFDLTGRTNGSEGVGNAR
jgi:hypothetical protein